MNLPFSLFVPYCLTMRSHKTRRLLGFSIQDALGGDWRGREGREVEANSLANLLLMLLQGLPPFGSPLHEAPLLSSCGFC